MIEDNLALKRKIEALLNQPYQTVQSLKGQFQFPDYFFKFIRIQGSPGANPASIVSVKISRLSSGFPEEFFTTSYQRLALADFLIRRFNLSIKQFALQNRGKDGSGSFNTIALSQKMLERDCVLFIEDKVEIRFIFSLPATGSGGGKLDTEQTWQMFEQELNAMVEFTLNYKKYNTTAKKLLKRYVDIQINRQIITRYMVQHELCVFINNVAILPRISGVDDKPSLGEQIKSFQSPQISKIEITGSEGQIIQGMAIKTGITCITGGGYHGKSTLMQAIVSGVYAHIPGDGRELIVTREDAVFVRAEEGRSIQQVDISSFIGQLPNGQTTQQFSSKNASGSTSQAASIVEAIESGSRLLLFDEDTCATNFLYRDTLINKVLDADKEPIKALYSTLRSIWHQHQVSMIFVIGGLGSFLQKADTCLLMEDYQCKNITDKVRNNLGDIKEDDYSISFNANRMLSTDNFNPEYVNQRLKKTIASRIKDLRNAPRQLEYGMDLINLEALPQVVEAPQILSIGYCLLAIRDNMQQYPEKKQSIEDWLLWLYRQLSENGLDFLQPNYPGTLSLPRKYEVAAAINRLRSLKMSI